MEVEKVDLYDTRALEAPQLLCHMVHFSMWVREGGGYGMWCKVGFCMSGQAKCGLISN